MLAVKSRGRFYLFITGALLLALLASWWRRAHLESSQDKNILTASRKYGVDPALIKAVIWRESRFHPEAKGGKGETGLMQIMEDTGKEWAAAQHIPMFTKHLLRDPVQNIDCGTWYLRKLSGRYTQADDPMPYTLADYNAGRSNVLKWMKDAAATNSARFIEQVGFASTRDYIRTVMHRRKKYVKEFAEKGT